MSDARYAFSEQPLSRMGTPVTLAISRLAMREGILRDTSLSWRSWRQPDHDVVALVHELEKLRNIARIVLQVAVHGDDHVTARGLYARRHCGGLPVVASELHHAHARILLGKTHGNGERAVAAAVVDEHHFEREAERLERVDHRFVHRRNAFLFVIEGHADRYFRTGEFAERHVSFSVRLQRAE